MLKLAIFGNPVNHSRSPELHHAFAAQAHLSIDYQKITVVDDFAAALSTFIDNGGHGCNITAPYKAQAFSLMNACSHHAKVAQAINTIQLRPNGELWGDNTDGVGFIHDLTVNKGFTIADKVIVIHGAGGAVRGLIPALLAHHPKELWLLNRAYAKACALAAEPLSQGRVQAIPYGQSVMAVDLVVDGSSFACDNFTGLQALQFSPNARAYDLKYANAKTPFLQWASSRGIAHGNDGFGMLVEQAALSFFLWTGFAPQTQALLG